MTRNGQTTFGLFLNLGANLGQTPEDVFALTLKQAQLAEALGLHDLWVTEHHFIDFGINPSALTTSAFLLGRTERIRVGTAVTLSPLYHPVELAERGALLDQLSGGRFDLGLGRGGYLKDYEVLDRPVACWDSEPVATAERILSCWSSGMVDDVPLKPPVRSGVIPSLYLATGSEPGISFAAQHGLGLQHYFAAPAEARVATQKKYEDAGGADLSHMHALLVVVDDAPDQARAQLQAALTESFREGNHPHVPQAKPHRDAEGNRIPSEALAKGAAEQAIIGPPSQVEDELGTFVETTGAKRLVVYAEAIASEAAMLRTIETVADLGPLSAGQV